MKTNNVDFGKSFKFICRSDAGETVYTCHKANKDEICKVTWLKFYTEDKGSTTFTVPNIKKSIEEGHWIVLPSDTKEILGDIGPELNFSLNKNDRITEDNLLDQIKHFTATSNHSVFIHNGYFEVYQAGMAEFTYKCKDDDTLRSVMQALSVLDGVESEPLTLNLEGI